MTPFPFFVSIDEPLGRARALMDQHGIRHLPVTREGDLVGIVTDREIGLLESATEPARSTQLLVRDACALDAYVVDVSERLDRVLREMAKRESRAALVVRHNKLAGILTETDACRAFAEFLRLMFPGPSADDAA